MFALEIDFHDGVSPPEVLLVRRPHAIIGSSEYSHVVIEGAASGLYELRITRGVGREFTCQPIGYAEGSQNTPSFLEGVYSGETELNLGEVVTHITPLDVDLQLEDGESPDLAGVRTLRLALSRSTPVFPAIAVLGSIPIFVSFNEDDLVFIGRSRKCGLRLDSSEVSSEHARMGYDDGQFWVEDLGSTNGTFVSGERVSGRRFLEVDETVTLGTEFTLAGVSSQEEVLLLNESRGIPVQQGGGELLFPCVVAKSDLVRPRRVALRRGARISIGRDPSNDIWVGAAYVSRRHAEVICDDDGVVYVADYSSNGSKLNRQPMPREAPVPLEEQLNVIVLGGPIQLAVCFGEDDEEAFIEGSEIEQEAAIPDAVAPEQLEVPAPEPVALKPEPQMPRPSVSLGGENLSIAELKQSLMAKAEVDELSSGEFDTVESRGGGVFERLAERAAAMEESGSATGSGSTTGGDSSSGGSDSTTGANGGLAGRVEAAVPETFGWQQKTKSKDLQVVSSSNLSDVSGLTRWHKLLLGFSIVFLLGVLAAVAVWILGGDIFID